MIPLNLPDEASEEEIEAFLAGLRADARAGVRRLLQAGAGEAEINEYIAGLDETPEEEAYDELEPRPDEESPEGAA